MKHGKAIASSTSRRTARQTITFRPAYPAAAPIVYSPAPVLPLSFAPMLATLECTLPTGEQWRYEPKFDGFRGLLWHAQNGHVQVLSRNLRDLAPWFPEVVQSKVQRDRLCPLLSLVSRPRRILS
jgi:ATP-dependent DNA ligase